MSGTFDRRYVAAAILAGMMSALFGGPAFAADPKLAGQTVPADQDRDGRPDHWITYNDNGVRVLISSDTNGDGKPDYWKHPIRGLMILKERDTNFDGRVDDRQVSDFIYDKALKINRNLYLWRETDTDFDGTVDVYKVRGNKNPVPDHRGQKMDVTPWSVSKEAAQEQAKAAAGSVEMEQVRQMNARQAMRS